MKRTSQIGSWRLSTPVELPVAGQVEEILWGEIMAADIYGLGALAEEGVCPGVIWDIGANAGFFATAAHAVWPEAKIICWEPASRLAAQAQKNVPAAVVRHAAAGPVAGTGILRTWPESWGAAGATLDAVPAKDRDLRQGPEKTERVAVEVPWEVAEAPDLLKLDCEGSEWDLLSVLPVRPEIIIGEGHGEARESARLRTRLNAVCPDYDWLTFLWNRQFRGRRKISVSGAAFLTASGQPHCSDPARA